MSFNEIQVKKGHMYPSTCSFSGLIVNIFNSEMVLAQSCRLFQAAEDTERLPKLAAELLAANCNLPM